MRAGRLRHIITVENYSYTQNDWGEVIEEWVPLGDFPAAIEPINGREYFAAQANQSEATTRIRTRYIEGIDSTARITHGTTVYDIQSVINPEMKNAELVFMCRSRG